MATLIKERFALEYTVCGTCYLLHRIGRSPQVPHHHTVGRDEEAIAAWRAERCLWRNAHGGNSAWICFLDGSGQSLRSPRGRTWAPIGWTRIVTGNGSGCGSLACSIRVRPGPLDGIVVAGLHLEPP